MRKGYCLCGCKQKTSFVRGNFQKYIHNHHIRGKIYPTLIKEKVSLGRKKYFVEHPEALLLMRKDRKDQLGYRGLHRWVERKLGIPTECSFCKKKSIPKIRRTIQWANKSREYKKDINDWIPLCIPCHKKYDSKKLP